MLRKRIWRVGALLAVVAVAAPLTASGAPLAAKTPTQAGKGQATKLRIWSDRDRKPAVERLAAAYAQARGVDVEVIEKNFGDIRDQLKTVQPDNAPDVIVAAHDWTGELAASGLVLPLFPRAAVKKQFPGYALEAFSYGTAVKRQYGMPVALENIGLVVNTQLAGVPKSFADLQKKALAFKKKARGNLGLAIPQAPSGDAYHMYPFFSGLCGYIFGRNRAGNLDPSDIGLDEAKFMRNTALIDTWNKSGFISSKIDYTTARDSFLKKKAAFWITGPWESDTLKKSGLKFRIVQVPSIRCKSVPFLGVQGFMATKFSTQHGAESVAKDFVGSYVATAGAQQQLAASNGRFPANTAAGRTVKDPVLAQFGKAGAGGVPMPNIPQMASVWSELGGAWVKATRGGNAIKARIAFRTAARNIANKIG